MPTEAREKSDTYLATKNNLKENDPLIVSRFGNRIIPRDVARTCERISKQASAQLPEKDKFVLRPHQLRHTFLKRVTDKHGLHYAKKLSGNVGIRELYWYFQPSREEVEEKVEGLYE